MFWGLESVISVYPRTVVKYSMLNLWFLAVIFRRNFAISPPFGKAFYRRYDYVYLHAFNVLNLLSLPLGCLKCLFPWAFSGELIGPAPSSSGEYPLAHFALGSSPSILYLNRQKQCPRSETSHCLT
jgi:hypothetical protein